MKYSILFLFYAINYVYASTIFCESWFNKVGGTTSTLERVKMKVVSETTKNIVYEKSLHGFDFRVDWDVDLTTFYISIFSNGKYILGTTARVPTPNHPENFTDLNLPNGPRLAVNCEMK